MQGPHAIPSQATSPGPAVYSWHIFTPIEAMSDRFNGGGLKRSAQPPDTSIALGKTNGAGSGDLSFHL